MAGAIVNLVVNKLCEPALKEALFLYGVDDQVNSIKNELGRLKCFLRDADSRKKDDESVNNWVKELRTVSFEIEDAIDTFLVKVGGTYNEGDSICETLKRLALKLVELVARHKLGKEIERIRGKIREISESRSTYGIRDLGEREVGCFVKTNLVIPDIEDVGVVGFEVDKKNIVDQLLDHETQRRLVISIVGTGGLGKTTLAKKVYNSQEVKSHFQSCIWLTVSQEFNLIDILKKILKGLGSLNQNEENEGVVHLITEINRSLVEKKYLIVMDDVWKENVWSQINQAFPDTNNGSRVLITTRRHNVGKRAGSSSSQLYKLRFLTENESLELLLRKAFPYQNDPIACCSPELIGLAKQLAKRSRGLPLALVVVGGLLSIKPATYPEWCDVVETMNWHDEGAECIDILATSYHDLPYFLKPCFLYLACFPEDYAIRAKQLIRMWIAEAFIPHMKGETFEATAKKFLEELVQRCLVQVTERSSYGVHDLIRDLAIHEATETGFLITNPREYTNASSNVARRLALHYKDSNLKRGAMPNLRSLLMIFQTKEVPSCISFPLL